MNGESLVPTYRDLTVARKGSSEKAVCYEEKSTQSSKRSPRPNFGRIGSECLLHEDLQGVKESVQERGEAGLFPCMQVPKVTDACCVCCASEH